MDRGTWSVRMFARRNSFLLLLFLSIATPCPNSAITELGTADSPEYTALSANRLLTVQMSTPRSPLWPLALSFRRLGGLPQDPIANLGPQVFAKGEDLSPVISNLEIHPKKGPAGTTFTITLRITDPQGPDDIMRTLFQMREGRESIEIVINDDGLNSDVSKGDGIYTGKDRVPKTAAKVAHHFEVFVRDASGHRSNLLAYTFTVLEGVVI